jgi:hypothetical protein
LTIGQTGGLQPSAYASTARALAGLESTTPGVVAPSQPALVAGELVNPTLAPLNRAQFEVTGSVADSTIARDPVNGFTLFTNWGDLTFTPRRLLPHATDAMVVRDDSLLFANTDRASDTVVRPTAMGLETFVRLRDRSAPESFSWKVELSGGQALRELSDGGIAIVADMPEAARSSARPGGGVAGPVRRDTVDPDAAPDVGAQVTRAQQALRTAGSESQGFLVAALAPPAATDAHGKSVPVRLSARGDTVTMTVSHRSGDFTYPLVADPDLVDCRIPGPNPCGRYNPRAAVAYALKWGPKRNGSKQRNPSYPLLFKNDCTSFASQVLRAGGLGFMRNWEKGKGSWFARRVPGYIQVFHEWTHSWSVVSDLEHHLEDYQLAVRIPRDSVDWRPGDLMFVDDHKTGADFDHVTVVTSVQPDGTPQVTQHTNDYANKPWQAFWLAARQQWDRPQYVHLRPVHAFANISD